MDREILAEKSLSQDFSASNVGVITPVQHIHLSIEIVFSFFSAPIAHQLSFIICSFSFGSFLGVFGIASFVQASASLYGQPLYRVLFSSLLPSFFVGYSGIFWVFFPSLIVCTFLLALGWWFLFSIALFSCRWRYFQYSGILSKVDIAIA